MQSSFRNSGKNSPSAKTREGIRFRFRHELHVTWHRRLGTVMLILYFQPCFERVFYARYHGFSLRASCQIGIASAAHSRRRISFRVMPGVNEHMVRYDRSITTFDPSGRLLQVEYGMEASSRGESIAAAIMLLSDMDERRSQSEESFGAGDSLVNDGTEYARTKKKKRKKQKSHLKNEQPDPYIVVVTKRSASSVTAGYGASIVGCGSGTNSKVHRLDDHLYMFTAGLAGDARALADRLRVSCQQYRLSHAEPITVAEAAQQVAYMQHELTRTAGARPLGCTAILVGWDPVQGQPRVFRSDPGGIVEDCIYCSSGKDQDRIMQALNLRYHTQLKDNADIAGVMVEMVQLVATATGDAASATSAMPLVNSNNKIHSNKKDGDENGTGSTSSFDIWLLQRDFHRRGHMRVQCYANVQLLPRAEAVSDE